MRLFTESESCLGILYGTRRDLRHHRNACCLKPPFLSEQPSLHLPQALLTLAFGGLLLQQWSFTCRVHRNLLLGLWKPRLLDPSPRVLEVLSLGWGPGVCTSYPFTGDTASAGLGTPLWEPLPYRISQGGEEHKFIKPTEQPNLPSDISPWSKAIVFYLEWRIEGYAWVITQENKKCFFHPLTAVSISPRKIEKKKKTKTKQASILRATRWS